MQAASVVEGWCEKWFAELWRRHPDERYNRKPLSWAALRQATTEIEFDLCRRDHERASDERIAHYPAEAVVKAATQWFLKKVMELPRDKNRQLNPTDQVFLAIIDQAFQRAFGIAWWEARRGARLPAEAA